MPIKALSVSVDAMGPYIHAVSSDLTLECLFLLWEGRSLERETDHFITIY